MCKVVDVGEAILDIIFRNDQPPAAVPGGSVFNGIVSLGHMGVNMCFISEIGNDRIGNTILRFMCDSHIPTGHIDVLPDGKSPVSLAFLNEHSGAGYIFYKGCPKQRLDVLFFPINEDDIIATGSYYALNLVLRDKILELLNITREKKATVYYDPSLHSSHKNEAMKLTLTVIKNLKYADIVRGSLEDFYYVYGTKDVEKIYEDKIKLYYPLFLCTAGAEKTSLHINTISKEYSVTPLQAVSTIDARGNFNTGPIYSMLKYDVHYRDLQSLSEETWDKVIQCGQDFSVKAYKSFSNSVPEEFVANYR